MRNIFTRLAKFSNKQKLWVLFIAWFLGFGALATGLQLLSRIPTTMDIFFILFLSFMMSLLMVLFEWAERYNSKSKSKTTD